MQEDLAAFKQSDLRHRLLRGGLPPFFLAQDLPERDFQEWIDGYWAKDIQELFRLERRQSFQRFFEMLMAQSGGIFEATRFADPCEVSRPTIANYLAVLEATFVVHVIRPFNTRRAEEIVSAPKVYGFDTGFICYHRGWNDLGNDDLGYLWEHMVLNEMHARLQSRRIQYWRNKHGNEIDFIIAARGREISAIEVKWSPDDFEPRHLQAFRSRYPRGANLVVTAAPASRPSTRKFGELSVRFVDLPNLIAELQ